MCKSLRQFAIVRQQKQTFSLRVQTADVEEAGKFLRKQIEDCIACVRISSGRNKSGGFVQHNGNSGSGTNEFAVNFDVVVRGRLCAEVSADFPVDGNATLRDQLITISPGTDAGSREETVQAQEKKLQG
jgi:hypothetical protein